MTWTVDGVALPTTGELPRLAESTVSVCTTLEGGAHEVALVISEPEVCVSVMVEFEVEPCDDDKPDDDKLGEGSGGGCWLSIRCAVLGLLLALLIACAFAALLLAAPMPTFGALPRSLPRPWAR